MSKVVNAFASFDISSSEFLYGIGVVLVVLGAIIMIQGFWKRNKEKKNVK